MPTAKSTTKKIGKFLLSTAEQLTDAGYVNTISADTFEGFPVMSSLVKPLTAVYKDFTGENQRLVAKEVGRMLSMGKRLHEMNVLLKKFGLCVSTHSFEQKILDFSHEVARRTPADNQLKRIWFSYGLKMLILEALGDISADFELLLSQCVLMILAKMNPEETENKAYLEFVKSNCASHRASNLKKLRSREVLVGHKPKPAWTFGSLAKDKLTKLANTFGLEGPKQGHSQLATESPGDDGEEQEDLFDSPEYDFHLESRASEKRSERRTSERRLSERRSSERRRSSSPRSPRRNQ